MARRVPSGRRLGASSRSFWWRRWSGAVPFPQVHHPLTVPQDLDLYVLGLLYVLLQVDGGVAEGGARPPGPAGWPPPGPPLGVDHPHPPAPAPGAGLEDHGVADLPGVARFLASSTLPSSSVPRDRGHPGLPGHLSRRGLVPQRPACSPEVGPMKVMPCSRHISAKVAFSARKPHPGVDGVRPRYDGRGEEVGDAEVALPRKGVWADADGPRRRGARAGSSRRRWSGPPPS